MDHLLYKKSNIVYVCRKFGSETKKKMRDNVTHLNFHYFQSILKLLVISQKQIYGDLALGET